MSYKDRVYLYGPDGEKPNVDVLTLTVPHKNKKHTVQTPIKSGSIWIGLAEDETVQPMKALIDTGATFSFISQSFLNLLVRSNAKVYKSSTDVTITVANRERVHSDTSIGFNFTIEGKTVNYLFYLLKDLSHPIILGVNFLRKYDAKIHMGSGSPSKSIDLDKTAHVVSLETCSVEPHETIVLKCCANSIDKLVGKTIWVTPLGSATQHLHVLGDQIEIDNKKNIFNLGVQNRLSFQY